MGLAWPDPYNRSPHGLGLGRIRPAHFDRSNNNDDLFDTYVNRDIIKERPTGSELESSSKSHLHGLGRVI